ncbi:phosphatase PAP2 family protein [Planctomycetota bacterium]|nr:phosphatase PAP2 family protein [Planctomycetota bacterium]
MKQIDPDKLYSPLSLKFHLVKVVGFLAVSLALMAVAVYLDFPAWDFSVRHNEGLQEWTESDSYRMLRVMGYLPVWIVITVALILHDTRYLRKLGFGICAGRGLLLILTTGAAGICAELVKFLVKRERPPKTLEDLGHQAYQSFDLYTFRPFWGTETRAWHETGGLGFPSSHAIVAFAAAFILTKLFPRAIGLWVLLAVGCAATRVLRFGHYVSDVTASAIFAYAIAQFFWNWHLYNQRELIRENDGKLPIG